MKAILFSDFIDGLIELYSQGQNCDNLIFIDCVAEQIGGGGYYITDDDAAQYYMVMNDYKEVYFYTDINEARGCAGYSVQPNLGGYSDVVIYPLSRLPEGAEIDENMDYL